MRVGHITGATLAVSTPIIFPSLSGKMNLFTGGATKSFHTFQVCHDSTIQTVNSGGFTYWAYYTLAGSGPDVGQPPFECHMARSNSLTGSWVDYGKVFDGRWPSVYYDSSGTTFNMFYCRPSPDDYLIKRATSSDGITFIYQEDVVTGGNNPFIWKNPNDNQWYLFYHDGGGRGYRIISRTASALADLDGASDVVLINTTLPTAAPSMFYSGGKYNLLVETLEGNVWHIRAYRSDAVNGPFAECWNSPLLTNDDAGPIGLMSGSDLYLYYIERTNVGSDYWDIDLRTATP